MHWYIHRNAIYAIMKHEEKSWSIYAGFSPFYEGPASFYCFFLECNKKSEGDHVEKCF